MRSARARDGKVLVLVCLCVSVMAIEICVIWDGNDAASNRYYTPARHAMICSHSARWKNPLEQTLRLYSNFSRHAHKSTH